ncbi:hypothetical protein CGC20_3800 [Leishmania donovani]|nr:hypothetical protein CGC20_3800 [Leishmania donovani]TPP42703.1 hypothetical protein CGC21_11940 [Leishmania donovani]
MEGNASEAHVHSGMAMGLQERPPLELASHASEVSCLTLNDNYDMWNASMYPNLNSGFDASLTSATTPDATAAWFAPAMRPQRKQQLSHQMMPLPARSEQTTSDIDSEVVLWDRPPTQEVLTPPAASGL